MRKITKRFAVIGTAVAVAIGGGVAWAAWTASGHATASASTGSSQAVQVSGAVLDAPLIPQHKVGVKFSVYNPNNFKVHVTGASIGPITSTKADCDSASFVELTHTIAPFDINPGVTTNDVLLPEVIQLTSDPDNDCQDAGIQFEVNVDAESAAA